MINELFTLSQLLAEETSKHTEDVARLSRELESATASIASLNTQLTAALVDKGALTAAQEALARERAIVQTSDQRLKEALALLAKQTVISTPPTYELSVTQSDETGKIRKLRLSPVVGTTGTRQ